LVFLLVLDLVEASRLTPWARTREINRFVTLTPGGYIRRGFSVHAKIENSGKVTGLVPGLAISALDRVIFTRGLSEMYREVGNARTELNSFRRRFAEQTREEHRWLSIRKRVRDDVARRI
jgi:hypothetical protein